MLALLVGGRTLLGAPGLPTRSKKLLGAPGIATRSKDANRLEAKGWKRTSLFRCQVLTWSDSRDLHGKAHLECGIERNVISYLKHFIAVFVLQLQTFCPSAFLFFKKLPKNKTGFSKGLPGVLFFWQRWQLSFVSGPGTCVESRLDSFPCELDARWVSFGVIFTTLVDMIPCVGPYEGPIPPNDEGPGVSGQEIKLLLVTNETRRPGAPGLTTRSKDATRGPWPYC